jgi:hypothetical protein
VPVTVSVPTGAVEAVHVPLLVAVPEGDKVAVHSVVDPVTKATVPLGGGALAPETVAP